MKKLLTEEEIYKIVSDLMESCDRETLFTTADGMPFVYYDNACQYAHDYNIPKEIKEWFYEYSGNNPIPKLRYQIVG